MSAGRESRLSNTIIQDRETKKTVEQNTRLWNKTQNCGTKTKLQEKRQWGKDKTTKLHDKDTTMKQRHKKDATVGQGQDCGRKTRLRGQEKEKRGNSTRLKGKEHHEG